MVLKFRMQHGQTLWLQNDKIPVGRESKMAANAKNYQNQLKSTFSPEWHDIFG